MIYPWRPGSWNYNAKYARDVFVEIAHILGAYEDVYMIVRSEDMNEAVTRLNHPHIHIIEASSNDAWARDTGPTFVINDNGEIRTAKCGGLTGNLMPGVEVMMVYIPIGKMISLFRIISVNILEMTCMKHVLLS